MAISLSKGQKIDLTKTNPGLDKVTVGLGWDPIKSGGFSLFGGGGSNLDADASVLQLDANGKIAGKNAVIYFGNKKGPGIQHSGDNLTGQGDGDDEQIVVNLSQVDSNVHRLVFVVNIYQARQRKQHFGQVQNAYIRVLDNGNNELCRFNLTENHSGKTALVVGEMYRYNDEWKFGATGDGYDVGGLEDLIRLYN